MDHGRSCTSYPRPDQMHYWPPHYAPHHMHMMSPAQPPASSDYQHWNNNIGYSSPMICQNCGSNSFSTPNYFWRPPYAYSHPYNFPTPSPYMPPPQSYQPWYDFQGNVAREANHCCGCPTHVCGKKEMGNVRIEEEGEPIRDCKKNDSLIPYKFHDWPFPAAWKSPRDYYIKGEERGLPEKLGMTDLRKLGSLNQKSEIEEGNRRVLHREDGNGDARLPFPIIWMPHQPEEKEKNEKDVHRKIENTEPKAGTEKIEDPCLEKDIKVDQGISRSKEKESRPVKNVDSDGEKGANSENGAQRQSISKSKSPSKLPPVCLRVDPLPRRKGENVGKKAVSQKANETDTTFESSSPDKAAKSDDTKKGEVKKTKGITKTIQVEDGSTTDGGEITVHKVTTKQHDEDLEEEKIPQDHSEILEGPRKSQSEDDSVSEGVEKNAEKPSNVTKEEEISKSRKRELNCEEAAVVIQSAYRGFDVRRWEPLKKLKQIAKVREEMAEVKNLIQEMERSPDVRDTKQRTVISEIIMSLLLRLDTIQGLLPSLRDVRKSVVRELVALQEKLDALVINEQEAVIDDVTSPQEGDLPEPPQNHVDGESQSNDNTEVSDNDGVGELGNDGPELLIESSNTPNGTELSSDAITGEEDEGPKISEEEHDVASVLAKNEDHGVLTSDISSDQGKESDRAKTDETTGLETSGDARVDDEADKEHVAVKQVSHDIINDELMSENITADDARPREDADIHSSIGEGKEQSLDEISEDSTVPEKKTSESAAGNEVAGSEEYENDDSRRVSDSPPRITHEAVDSIDGSEEISEERSEIVRDDSDAFLGPKEEESYATGDSISNNVPREVLDDEEEEKEAAAAKSQITSDDLPNEVFLEGEEAAAKRRSISPVVVRNGVLEEEESSIAFDYVPSQACNEEKGEEKNRSFSVLEEEKRVEADSDNIEPFNTSEAKKEGEKHEKKAFDDDDIETGTTSEEKTSEHNNRKLMEENEKLREMMEKLIKSGQEQLDTISNLSYRIDDLEKKLSRKKRALKMNRCGGRKKRSVKPLMPQSHNVV